MTTIMLACCLIAAAVVLGWPVRASAAGRPWIPVAHLRRRVEWVVGRPRRLVLTTAGSAGALGWLAAGPVAGVVGAVYGALAGRAYARRLAARRQAAARRRDLDDLCALAADLRAGLPPAVAPMLTPGRERSAIFRLAERTGAPAAELFERVEADARTADRGRASAAAQAAGAQATALLLAALPVAGIAIGFSIGADPVQVLFHTPLGAGCAVGAALLQSAGLLWADRLVAR